METTLNMRTDILKRISIAARKSGITRSRIAIYLIKQAMGDINKPEPLGRMVQYQTRRRPEEWQEFHLRLREDDYEYLQDLRKLLKMSVSLILSIAVQRYLVKFSKSKITDNYRFKNYVLIKEIFDNIISWRLIWGFPPDPGKLFLT
jgi:hypothetical protein